MNYLESFREMISLRGLTDHTIKSYSTYIRAYLEYLDSISTSPEDATWDIMRDFIKHLQKSRKLSDRTVNACISQLRCFTMYVLHKPWDCTQVPMRKFDQYMPYVPTQSEVMRFISTMPNLKDKAMVALMYSAGLRVGEVCHLKYEDISRKAMRIHITHGKNRSDRYAILSENALAILTQYWFKYDKPCDWLFPSSYNSDVPVSTNTVMRHIAEHEERLGLPHQLTCHSFRHAFGTHLYENGTDLLTIKALLGHKSINSTTIYVHLASNGTGNALSPFDSSRGANHE